MKKPPLADKNDLKDAIERVINLAHHPIFPDVELLAWKDSINKLEVMLGLIKDGKL